MLPTAAKLVAAIALAALAWMVSNEIRLLFPAGKAFGNFNWVNAGVGFLAGWFWLGPRVGRSWAAAVSYGITTTVAAVLCAVGIHAAAEMVKLAMRHRYGGPVEALGGMVSVAVDYLGLIATPEILTTLLVGAVLAGLLARAAPGGRG